MDLAAGKEGRIVKPTVQRVYQQMLQQGDGSFKLMTIVQFSLDGSGPLYLWLDPATATSQAVTALMNAAAQNYGSVIALAQPSDPQGLNVHDIVISQVPAYTAAGAQILNTQVKFSVGTHGPFTLTFPAGSDTAAAISASIQNQQGQLRNLLFT